jgi:hypothetical protein
MSSPILARADALMQRRRQSNPEPDDVPLLVDAISPEDEIPLLVDVETPAPPVETALAVKVETEAEVEADVEALAEPTAEVETAAPAEATPQPAPEPAPSLTLEGEILDIIAHELACRVQKRLAAELPGIVESTIREFLAEPEILALIQPRD